MKTQPKPVALVTGAASGIGRAIGKQFADSGYKVVGIDCQNKSDLGYDLVNFDIARLHENDDTCKAFYKKIRELVRGRIDVLINNAAVQIIKPIERISTDDWDITLQTNLLAPFWLIKNFLSYLRFNKGCIVNIASIHANLTKAKFSIYATSKGALVSMTRALAIELAPEIRVNSVIPAATDTNMLLNGFQENKEEISVLGFFHPLKRIATPEEVAHVVYFLAGQQASFITGATVNVDGGIGSLLCDPDTVKFLDRS
jgi:NAD(P)-dependent dehydrogenase (short-subunit alcohol dehydrogenase family)